jgi:substrate import-associated zinc metallohydrolase lipoprotein
MTLKNILNISLCGLLLVTTGACNKSSDTLDVDMSKYVVDRTTENELDKWITTSLTDPYNIQLVYRFERNLMDVGKDVSPVKLEKVKPTAEAIINIFLKTYEKVGGAAFIKTYTPKQFVLYGSPAYNPNGSVTLGSAEGGRKVVLYELNDLDFTNPAQVSRKMRTIHHEFTHILNQMISIQPEFQQVTKADYYADWTNTSANSEDTAKKLGFVSRYARSAYTEDFAEMVAHLLIEGQLSFDTYAKSAGPVGMARLKKKEALVVDYFRQYFNINFRQLQYEVGKMLRDTYNDKTRAFTYAMQNGLLANALVINFTDGTHYAEFGQSAQFKTVWDACKTSLATGGRTPVSFNVVWLSKTRLQLQMNYVNSANSSLVAWYDFDYTINSSGDITFTFFDNPSTETQYNNGRTAAVRTGFTPLINYLTNNTFKGDWIPVSEGGSYYLKFGGFYVKSDPSNYFYGKF